MARSTVLGADPSPLASLRVGFVRRVRALLAPRHRGGSTPIPDRLGHPGALRSTAVRRLLVLVALAGCFERGSAPRHRDAAVARDAGVGIDAPLMRAEPTGPRDPDATITIALEAEPASLDPLLGADHVTQRVVMGDVYEALLRPGAALADRPVAGLAASWTLHDGGREWRIVLRDARWHDGHALTSRDVQATFEAVRAQGSWLAGDLADLEAVELVAAREVRLRWRTVRVDRDTVLARIPILPATALADVDLTKPGALAASALARAPIGTGPLRVTEWRAGDRIELARWDGYHGAPAGAARVIYRVVADRAEALRLLEAGDVDVAVQVPVDEATRFAAAHPAIGRFGYRLPAYVAAVLNTRRRGLATPEARRALTALLDRDGVARLLGSHAITGPFPDSDPGFDRTIAPIPFDRALAQRLLAGARPTLEILVPQGSTSMARVADIWASDARGVIALSVLQVPYAELLTRMSRGDFDIALTSMTTGPELDLSARLSSTAPPEDAWCGLSDPELDRLLAAVTAEPSADVRAELRRALHRRIADLAPLVFISADIRQGLARASIGGIASAPEGTPPAASALWRAR